MQHETSIAINTTGGGERGEAHVLRVALRTLCTLGGHLSALWAAEPPGVGPEEASYPDLATAASETTADADSLVSCLLWEESAAFSYRLRLLPLNLLRATVHSTLEHHTSEPELQASVGATRRATNGSAMSGA